MCSLNCKPRCLRRARCRDRCRKPAGHAVSKLKVCTPEFKLCILMFQANLAKYARKHSPDVLHTFTIIDVGIKRSIPST